MKLFMMNFIASSLAGLRFALRLVRVKVTDPEHHEKVPAVVLDQPGLPD